MGSGVKSRSLGKGLEKKRYLILLNIVLNEQGVDRESFIVRDQKF